MKLSHHVSHAVRKNKKKQHNEKDSKIRKILKQISDSKIINVSCLEEGIFFVTIKNDVKFINKKILVQR